MSAIESSAIVRQALRTPEGLRLMRTLGVEGDSLSALAAKLAPASAQDFRQALGLRLEQIDRTVRDLRDYRRNSGAPALTATEEAYFIDLLARRRLRLDRASENLLRDFQVKKIVFFEADSAAQSSKSYTQSRIDFLDGNPEPRDFRRASEFTPSQRAAETAAKNSDSTRPVVESAPGVSQRLVDQTRQLVNDMQTCRFYRTPTTQAESRLRYFLTGLAVNEAVVAGSYIVGMGVDEFQVEELSTDMLVAAIYTAAGTSVLKPNQRFRVQWFKVSAMIGAQDVLDSTIYFISPMHRLQNGGEGAHTFEDAAHRMGFNWAYTLGISGLVETSIFELITGLECLYPEARWMRVAPGMIRLGASTLSGLVYYELRSQTLGH
jgi:hypothetical protein